MSILVRNTRYYCHKCNRDVNSTIDHLICPNCELGFLELIDSNNRNEFVVSNAPISSSDEQSDTEIGTMSSLLINENHMIECKQCYICMEEFLVGETVLNLNCEHLFHNDCIIPWLSTHNTCPVCRIVVPNNPYSTRDSQRNHDYSDDERDLFDIIDDDFAHEWDEYDSDSDLEHNSLDEDTDSDTDSIGSVSSTHDGFDVDNDIEENRDFEEMYGIDGDYNIFSDDDEPIDRGIEVLEFDIDSNDSNRTDPEEDGNDGDEQWFDAHDHHLDELDLGDLAEHVDYDYDIEDNDYVDDDDYE